MQFCALILLSQQTEVFKINIIFHHKTNKTTTR